MSTNRRTTLITGAAMGLGQSIARRMAADGHDLIFADIASTEETEVIARDLGAEVRSFHCDVSSPDSVANLVSQISNSGVMPDVLIANAGIYPIKAFLETTWEDWRRIMGVNLDSLYLLFHAFLPGMVQSKWGRIVVVSSGAFYVGTPLMAPYCATKGGGIGLLRSVAAEVGNEGVTLNAVAPSLMTTPGTAAGPHAEMGWFDFVAQLQSIKRSSGPEDIVGAISFLSSDDAAFITGQTLPVDGGYAHV